MIWFPGNFHLFFCRPLINENSFSLSILCHSYLWIFIDAWLTNRCFCLCLIYALGCYLKTTSQYTTWECFSRKEKKSKWWTFGRFVTIEYEKSFCIRVFRTYLFFSSSEKSFSKTYIIRLQLLQPFIKTIKFF